MAKSEHDELQDLLAAAPEPEIANQRSYVYISPNASNRTIQWSVDGNDSFHGTSGTIATLPAGMYKLSTDDRGVIHFRLAPIKTDKLIDLKDPASEEIVNGIRTFWNSQHGYRKMGMLYKRGVLLWGPAGSGKTVTVTLLMKELVSAGGIVIFCEHPEVAVHALEILRRIEPDRPLITVLEDIEEIIRKHGEHTVLALLDGEHQVDNVVNIATTNYPELLGARIINRPSRFDHVKKIGMPNAAAREAYFKATVPKPFIQHECDRWVLDTEGMSIAHLRELVVAVHCLGNSYELTIDRLKKMSTHKQSSAEFKREIGVQTQKPPSRTAYVNGNPRPGE